MRNDHIQPINKRLGLKTYLVVWTDLKKLKMVHNKVFYPKNNKTDLFIAV